jgi:hypothetical protein
MTAHNPRPEGARRPRDTAHWARPGGALEVPEGAVRYNALVLSAPHAVTPPAAPVAPAAPPNRRLSRREATKIGEKP